MAVTPLRKLRVPPAASCVLRYWPVSYTHLDVYKRQFSTSNDVILYSVDDTVKTVYIRGVCTKGRDLTAHLEEQDSLK